MLLSQKFRKDTLYTFYVDDSNKVKVKKTNVKPYKWIKVEDKDKSASRKFKSWDGSKVKQVKAKTLDRYVSMETLWRMPEKVQDKIFSQCQPREAFVDIEVEFTNEFPKPEEVKYAISTIASVWLVKKTKTIKCLLQVRKELSKGDKSYVTRALKKHFSSYDEYNIEVSYVQHDSEKEMLLFFLKSVMSKFIVITGWYFVEFDWHYIYNRCKKLDIEIDEIFDYFVNRSNAKKINGVAFPCNKAIIDLMEIFSKYDRSIDVKESKTLDFTAKEVLGLQKINLKNTLDVLYEEDFKEYCFYNIVDSILCLLIEEKRKVLKLYYTLSCISLCDVRNTIKPTRSTETVLSKEFYSINKILPSLKWDEDVDKQTYDGAYVMEPLPGIYNWTLSRDFSSLYPTSARMGNISPETFRGNWFDSFISDKSILDQYKLEYVEYCKKRNYIPSNNPEITVGDSGDLFAIKQRGIYKGQAENLGNWFSEFISNTKYDLKNDYLDYLIKEEKIDNKDNFYIDPKGSVFDVSYESVYKRILERFYSNRKKHKKLMFSYKNEKKLIEELLNGNT